MKTAMILAAGRGERLRPLTEKIPKSLCSVLNRPLIEHHVMNLARAGFERLIINHAYLGSQIRQHLGKRKDWGIDICYSPEPPGGLETGGGIVNALALIGKNPFITVNADIYTDFDFRLLRMQKAPFLHLILVNKNPDLKHFGDFGLDDSGKLINTARHYTFSGIACYHPDVFLQSKIGRYSVIPLVRQYAEQAKATASVHHGIWYDIGSKERLEAVNQLI